MASEDYDGVYSHSQIASYLACERAYSYRYRDGWKPPSASRQMTLGTTVHHLLDGWWAGTDIVDLDADDVSQYVVDLGETATVEECISIAEHALWLIYRYDRMYEKDRETCTVLEVEKFRTFALPKLGERRFGITAKIDKLLDSRQHGGIVFMDHKTHGQFPKEDWIDIDPQFSLYFLALRAEGIEPVCALLDSIYTYRWKKKGEILPWDAAPVEDSFRRTLVDRSQAMLDVVAAEAYRACDRIWHLRQRHHEPLRTISPACTWCDFRAPCWEALQGDDASEADMLDTYFHPKKRPPVMRVSQPMEVVEI